MDNFGFKKVQEPLNKSTVQSVKSMHLAVNKLLIKSLLHWLKYQNVWKDLKLLNKCMILDTATITWNHHLVFLLSKMGTIQDSVLLLKSVAMPMPIWMFKATS